MKEIDLLPKWYKKGSRQRNSYHTQYVALGCVFVVIVVWSLIRTHWTSKAKSQLAMFESRCLQAQSTSKQYQKIKSELDGFQKKADVLKEIDSRINVANVLAEVSFLTGEKVVLNRVKLVAEKFTKGQQNKSSSGSVVRRAKSRAGRDKILPLGDVKFNIVITGIAARAADVADLVVKLENSPYFCQVYPSFSRNRTIKLPNRFGKGAQNSQDSIRKTKNDYQASEFEITCYLANYQQQKVTVAKNTETLGLER